MKAQVEVDTVFDKIDPQAVCSSPSNIFAHIDRRNRDNLDHNCDCKEERCSRQKAAHARLGQGRVDKFAQNKRIDQLQADPSKKQELEPKQTQALAAQVGGQKAEVVAIGDLHCGSSQGKRKASGQFNPQNLTLAPG